MNRSQAFAARPDSIRQARTFVEDALAGTELAALQSIVLMVSELATNSVRHAGSEFTVDVGSADDAVRVVITDRGAGDGSGNEERQADVLYRWRPPGP